MSADDVCFTFPLLMSLGIRETWKEGFSGGLLAKIKVNQ